MPHILVIGAGVIGLQTANDLLDAGYKVTILAKHWPGDESIEYASPWAGAIWRPQGSASETEVCDWQMQSYKYWTEIIEKRPGEAEEMGIQLLPLTLLTYVSLPSPPPL
ncbi:hypothetical protein GRF29_28g2534850 [Pseudopithomyces chartarum]|uniref:FAD dependent oxidoreductase domain-containing protein n=1 Tax=Pseudopithomyces chartarum TaxID=1892770 RepID=A0AAN6RL41_9PLEO|nr:hypothetical protein GRF29_28g2534850 [Pseudopithomyces chartarum]